MKQCTVALLLMTLACPMVFAAQSADRSVVAGTYLLKLTDQDKGLAVLIDSPLPSGFLALKEGHRFVLETHYGEKVIHRTGHFEQSADDITFAIEETNTTLVGHIKEDGLEVSGLKYIRQSDFDVKGKWHVKGIDARVEFKEDGTFKFASTNAVSLGKFTLEEGSLRLTWTSIDGEDQDADTIKKTIQLEPDGTFWIDNYHYIRN